MFIWEDGSLEILNVTRADEGPYTCFAENNRGKANSTGSLQVTGKFQRADLINNSSYTSFLFFLTHAEQLVLIGLMVAFCWQSSLSLSDPANSPDLQTSAVIELWLWAQSLHGRRNEETAFDPLFDFKMWWDTDSVLNAKLRLRLNSKDPFNFGMSSLFCTRAVSAVRRSLFSLFSLTVEAVQLDV